MSLGFTLLVAVVTVVVVSWLVMAHREPPLKRRVSADYRHQHTENPDYMPKGIGV